MSPAGRFVGVGAPHEVSMMALLVPLIKDQLVSVFGSQKALMFIAKSSQEDLTLQGKLIASGKLKPVIERRYPLKRGGPLPFGMFKKGMPEEKL